MKRILFALAGAGTLSLLAACTEGNNVMGATAAGAALGGVAGSVLFHGSTQTAAIIGSTVVGGIAGNAMGKKMNAQERTQIPVNTVCNSNPYTGAYSCVNVPVHTQMSYPMVDEPRHCKEVIAPVWVNDGFQDIPEVICQFKDGQWRVVE